MRALRVALLVLLVPPALAAGLLGAAGGVLGNLGRRNLDLDILAHFAPLWFAGGVAAFLVACLAARWLRLILAGLGVVAVLASGALIAPELIRDTGPKAPRDAAHQLKIVQLNAWIHNQTYDRMWAWIDRVDPDIVLFEETTDELRAAAVSRPGWHVSCADCEVMILSRRPPVRSRQARLLGPNPGPLTRAVFHDARGDFAVIGVHYAWPTDVGDQQSQEAGLAQMIARGDRDRTIVAGDFNSAPWSFSRRRWDARFGLIRRERALFSWPAAQSTRFTWLGAFPVLPIDHVYAGKDWATVKIERGPRVGSDHFPVVITLAPVAPR